MSCSVGIERVSVVWILWVIIVLKRRVCASVQEKNKNIVMLHVALFKGRNCLVADAVKVTLSHVCCC